jgi:hypothetical protein
LGKTVSPLANCICCLQRIIYALHLWGSICMTVTIYEYQHNYVRLNEFGILCVVVEMKDILLFHCFESVVSVAYQVCRFCFCLMLGV